MQDFWPQVVAGFRAITPTEWAAVVSSLICVYLTVRNNIWNWFWGFIGVALYGYLFWVWRNYANCALQILYYIPIQFVGWYVWSRGGKSKTEDVPITQLPLPRRIGSLAIVAAFTAFFYGLFRYGLPFWFPALAKDPVPFADALTTAISIVAQYLQVHKRFENWILWIAADIIYALYVFPVQKLYASMLLYVVFTVLAIIGAVDWVKIMRKQAAGEAVEEPQTLDAMVEPVGGASAGAAAVAAETEARP